MISCISPGLSHSFNCQGLSHVNWRRLASRLTINPGTAHLCIGCYHGPPVCVCVFPPPPTSVMRPHSSTALLSSPSNGGNGPTLIATRKDTQAWSTSSRSFFLFPFPSAVSVIPYSAAHLFNCCLSLTRTQRHSGGLSYSASATLALKWNDLISQLSIVKDIYKRY